MGVLWTGLALLVAVAARLPGTALAAPQVGAPFPAVQGKDVAGHPRNTADFRGQVTIIVAITDRNAEGAMRAWWAEADRRLPAGLQRKSIVSVGAPWFVSSSYARRKARGDVPPQYWDDTLLDIHHDMAGALGLGRGSTPWAFVLDQHGRVVAAVHARVDAPEARRIWAALESLGARR